MKSQVLLYSILSLLPILYVRSSIPYYTDKPANEECRRNAALKIVDFYALRIGRNYNIVDVDVIAHPMNRNGNPSLLSVQWIAQTGGLSRVYWISGTLEMDASCCSTRFSLREHSRSVNSNYIPSDLGCNESFIQQNLGPGEPFKRKRRLH